MDEERPDNFPGVFIKYSIESITVRITESRIGLVQLTTRLCGVIGGIYVTFGIVYRLSRWISDQFSSFKSVSSNRS